MNRTANAHAQTMAVDRTPVFHDSKQMTVTGMRVVVGGSVYPLSSVVGIDVCRKSMSYLLLVLQTWGVAAVVVAGRVFVVPFFNSLGGMDTLLTFSITLMAVAVVALAIVATLTFAFEKELVIRLADGGSRSIKSTDAKRIWEMHAAISRAMTYSANAARGVASVSDELGRLSQLLREGVLTQSDWDRAKDLFFGKQPTAQERAVHQLEQLHGLWRSGVLSESEFNVKKWEVLASMATA